MRVKKKDIGSKVTDIIKKSIVEIELYPPSTPFTFTFNTSSNGTDVVFNYPDKSESHEFLFAYRGQSFDDWVVALLEGIDEGDIYDHYVDDDDYRLILYYHSSEDVDYIYYVEVEDDDN